MGSPGSTRSSTSPATTSASAGPLEEAPDRRSRTEGDEADRRDGGGARPGRSRSVCRRRSASTAIAATRSSPRVPRGDGFLAAVVELGGGGATRAGRGHRARAPQAGPGALAPRAGPRAAAAPVRLGLGGKVGTGDQWWSWVALEDVAAPISSPRPPLVRPGQRRLAGAGPKPGLRQVARPSAAPAGGRAVPVVRRAGAARGDGGGTPAREPACAPAALEAGGYAIRQRTLAEALASALPGESGILHVVPTTIGGANMTEPVFFAPAVAGRRAARLPG